MFKFQVALIALGLVCLASAKSRSKVVDHPGRVVRATEAAVGSLPFIVSLQVGQHLQVTRCTGAILNAHYILISASCELVNLQNLTTINILVGEHDTSKLEGGEQPFKVEKIEVNPVYFGEEIGSNVAVMLLDRPIDFNNLPAVPIGIPSVEECNKMTYENCFVAGWGKTENGKVSPVLSWAEVHVLSWPECTAYYGQIIDPVIELCAGEDAGFNTCEGGKGNPLFCTDSTGQTLQVGVLAFERSCRSVAYTNLCSYRDWITMITSQ